MQPFTRVDNENGKQAVTDRKLLQNDKQSPDKAEPFLLQGPQLNLPKGGGAIKSIDEKFKINAANGTAAVSVPLPVSSARNGMVPQLQINYNSGSGNGIFGLGWNLSLSSISRKTDKNLALYDDAHDSDLYVLAEAEDLVPMLQNNGANWNVVETTVNEAGDSYTIKRYRPRIEGGFHKIERWTRVPDQRIHWRTVTADNITHIFGKTAAACVANPHNPLKIFRWLPELSYDDQGNCIHYSYKQENLVNVPNTLGESHRHQSAASFANAYPERVRYGPKTPFNPASGLLPEFMFETVFDYNEEPFPADSISTNSLLTLNNNWSCRKDPFSQYKSCFEIRTYRLCHRVWHFHHFAELGTEPYLVKSLGFDYYYDADAGLSLLEDIHSIGYKKTGGAYSSKASPPFHFGYEPCGWNTAVKEVQPNDLSNLPIGLNDTHYQFTDLYSEGIAGILSEQGTGWFYKSNLGNGHFEETKLVASKPSFTGLQEGTLQLQDLEGDGRKFIVAYDRSISGFFELTQTEQWLAFKNFAAMPSIDLKDPNIKFIDLNGDGRADILVSEDEVFYWYECKGAEGYTASRPVQKEWDEHKGPAVVFSSAGECIMLADMSGDGLTDIVRIRNGEIVYWPNLGYGRFGAKVTMSNAPWLDVPELFNAANIRLADINGSGVTDLVYITQKSLTVWFNENGNGWLQGKVINSFPAYDNSAHVAVLDLLGTGTYCIVWSSPLPDNGTRTMRYIDLLGGKRPFTLTAYENNMGKRVTLEYKPSTAWYLEDKKAGKHWITKLPFPVSCVAKVITEDLEFVDGAPKARLLFTQHFSYHHGYYDFAEKEFRGFGRVEQNDTEIFDHFALNDAQNVVEEALHQPPVKTITWYHTGAWFNQETILSQFEEEYTKGPLELSLPASVLPADLAVAEWPEASRACKNMMLRQEIFAVDETALQDLPYSTASHSCFIKRLQPKAGNRHAVFIVQESEAVTYTYERKLDDPLLAQTLNLEFDDFGHVLKTARIVYNRKQPDSTLPPEVQAEQQKINIVVTENEFTTPIDQPAAYRIPALAATLSWELAGIQPLEDDRFTAAELMLAFTTAAPIGYEQDASGNLPQKRLIEHLRNQFLSNDLLTPMPAGQQDTQGLKYQSYKQAFTPELVTARFGDKVNDPLMQEAGYVHLDDDNWWITSGRNIYLNDGETATAAAARFYTPVAAHDPFGHETKFSYAYSLLLTGTEDALQNQVVAEAIDYRLMQPVRMKDANENISEVLADEFGMVIATSIYGTETDGTKGDAPLSTYVPVQITSLQDVIDNPQTYLQAATSFFYYDLFAYQQRQQPCCFASITRETHVSELDGGETQVQISVSYSGGFGQNLQTKVQAAPGMAFLWQNGQKTEVDTSPGLRWIGNGRTIVNNKGNPVKQYEPYFSTTYAYESEKELVEIGFSPVRYYDPAGRNIRTDYPDGSFEKTIFNAWTQQNYDRNDTVLESDWYVQRGSPDAGAQEPAGPGQRAAWLTAKHANTYAQLHTDPMGRIIYTVTDNGAEGKYTARTVFDAENNQKDVFDARGNLVMQYRYNMLGQQVYQQSMDAGARWLLMDVMGKTLYAWDSMSRRFQSTYDALNRPLEQWLVEDTGQNNPAKLISLMVYGENEPNAQQRNLRGKLFRQFDQAGMIETTETDFKSNVKFQLKRLAIEYKTIIDWNLADPFTLLGDETYINRSRFDALNRFTEVYLPDGTVSMAQYNRTALLQKLFGSVAGEGQPVEFVKNIQYNAKGLRERIVYGNNTATRYTYEERTYRLAQLLTTRNNGADILQDLHYTYDPMANVTEIRDQAQQTIFFNNAQVDPHLKYEYDAVYRLTKAHGREHAGQNGASDQFDSDKTHAGNNRLTLKADMNAMQRYEEVYAYDAAGNMLSVTHNAGNNAMVNRWTREFTYNSNNNQIATSLVGGTTTTFGYDVHGNMLNLQNGSYNMVWGFAGHLKEADLGGGGTVYYVYGNGGQRVRKIIENGNIVKDRRYLGGYEQYRETVNNNLTLQRDTLDVVEAENRIALVEIRKQGDDAGLPFLIRYQYSNHLGSACLELDGDEADPQVITYEEYYPYGSTAFQACRNQTETPKRYRFTGKERDAETGLNYHNARYYAPWLCRWTAADPLGIKDGLHLYRYSANNPVVRVDPDGTENKPVTEQDKQVMMMTDPQMVKQLKGMTEAERHGLLSGTTGAFKNRVQAHLTRSGLSAAAPTTIAETTTAVSDEPVAKEGMTYDEIFEKVDYEKFKRKVEHLATDDKFSGEELRTDQTNMSQEHGENVIEVIGAAMDVTEERAAQRGDMNRRHRLIYSLKLVMEFRDKNNTHDLTFRDADHYFAGRVQEWQSRVISEKPLGAKKEDLPSEALSHLSEEAFAEYDAKKRKGEDVSVQKDNSASPPGGRNWPTIGNKHYQKKDVGRELNIEAPEKPTYSDAIDSLYETEMLNKGKEWSMPCSPPPGQKCF